MKRLFTTALLVGLLAFSNNSFAEDPKEYMIISYLENAKFYIINKAKTDEEKVIIPDRGVQYVLEAINSLTEEGWEVFDFEKEAQVHTYLLVREK